MTFQPAKAHDDLPPLAGSPPIKLEAPDSSTSSGSPSDEEEDSYDDGEQDDTFEIEEEGDEGDSDDAQEPSPSDAARRSQSGFNLQQSVNQSPPKFPAAPTPPPTRNALSGQAAVGQQPNPSSLPFSQPFKASPLAFGQSAATTQPTAPGGALKQPPSFPPPNRPVRPMRSPSPVRAASTSALGGEVRRQTMIVPEASLSASVRQSSPPTPQPQVSDLTDEEDERIRRELASDIEPSRTLDRFLARQEYTGTSAGKTGHAAQIEIVYRDINNMVDTLGLNWRSLKAFMDTMNSLNETLK
jgi:nucleoporin NUP159